MTARQCGSCGGFCGGGYTIKGKYKHCKAENPKKNPVVDIRYNSKIPLMNYPLFLIMQQLREQGFDEEKHTALIDVMNDQPTLYFRCTWTDKNNGLR